MSKYSAVAVLKSAEKLSLYPSIMKLFSKVCEGANSS